VAGVGDIDRSYPGRSAWRSVVLGCAAPTAHAVKWGWTGQKSAEVVVCAGRRRELAGESPSDRPQAGFVAEGGGNASLGAVRRRVMVAVGCRG
jgi:hypothetical protein